MVAYVCLHPPFVFSEFAILFAQMGLGLATFCSLLSRRGYYKGSKICAVVA